jgi:hypothetical protein
MQNNRPDSIRIGIYRLIDFNIYLQNIEQNIYDHLYDTQILESSNLKSISSIIYYELISTILDIKENSNEIPVISKFEHETILPFCTTVELEKTIFQKMRRLMNLIHIKLIFNEFSNFSEFAHLPISEKESKILKSKSISNLKPFFKFLEDNNMHILKQKIQKDPSIKSRLLLSN